MDGYNEDEGLVGGWQGLERSDGKMNNSQIVSAIRKPRPSYITTRQTSTCPRNLDELTKGTYT